MARTTINAEKDRARKRFENNKKHRRRDQSVKWRSQCGIARRAEDDYGWEEIAAIRRNVRGAAAGGVVCNPDGKLLTRPVSNGRKAVLRRRDSLPVATKPAKQSQKRTAPVKRSQLNRAIARTDYPFLTNEQKDKRAAELRKVIHGGKPKIDWSRKGLKHLLPTG